MIALVLIAFLSLALTASMKRFQFEQLRTKDERLSKIVEAVSYLKIIKLHVGNISYLYKMFFLENFEYIMWICKDFHEPCDAQFFEIHGFFQKPSMRPYCIKKHDETKK